jgi:hypothetical protein
MSKLDRNIRLARQCIDHVNGLNIKSNNVPFRLGTYYKFSKFHTFVLNATRCETVGVPDQVLQRRRQVLATLAHGTKPKQQKRTEIKTMMGQWGDDYFRSYTPNGFYSTVTGREDEMRIRSVRRVVKTRHGNCSEKSAVCATWLLENRPGNENIHWVGGSNYDHAWVVYDHNAPTWDGVISHLDSDAVVVDGWTGDYYQAKHPFKFWHGGGANPFQLTVRNNVDNASGNIYTMEHVKPRDWTESFSPHFTLAVADQPPSNYETVGSSLLRMYTSEGWADHRRDYGMNELDAITAAVRWEMEGLVDDAYALGDD